MAHSFLFGPQVSDRVRRWRNFARDLSHDFNARVFQRSSLVRIVRKQPNSFDAKLPQNRRGQTEIPAVSRKSERKIGIHCIEAGVLQRVGLQLRHQTDAAAILIFVDQKSPAFLSDGLHSDLQLFPAVTAQ